MDWLETTETLMTNRDIMEEYLNSIEFFYSFQDWASKKYPELYGND